MNEVMDMDAIKGMIGQTAFNVQNLSESMGVLTTQVKEMKVNMLRQDEKIKAVEDRLQTHEDRLIIDRNQAQKIRKAIHNRAADLLGIKYVNGVIADECIYDDTNYRGKFISRLYYEARNESRLGTPYTYTYQKDLSEVLDYINKWIPTAGVEGYKEYLDKRRLAKGTSHRGKRT